MMEESIIRQSLLAELNIDEKVEKLVSDAEAELKDSFAAVDQVAEIASIRMLKAFRDNRISDSHFSWNTGYGYDDMGREGVEQVYASYFGAEKALVRTNIVNGTHALAVALLGLLRAGDEVIYCTGRPYDTLQSVIGISAKDGKNTENDNVNQGTLLDMGVIYKEIDLLPDGSIDLEELSRIMGPRTKMVAVQRSMGYGWRNCITVNQIEELAKALKNCNPKPILMVDNCYCETLSPLEPTHVGADICCGSLIKNPGGGLALSGGYIVGKGDLVDQCAYRLTCPGIGAECGLTYGQTRGILEGFFISPRVSADALKAAILMGKTFENLGFAICPALENNRSDIIQAVRLGNPEALKAFCLGIQQAAPIDSFVAPVPGDMPGYDDQVIMAAGAFVQGASIELSADGPMREPYNVYFQGGLTYQHARLGVMSAVQSLIASGIITL